MSIRGKLLFLGHKNATRCISDPKQNLVNSGGIGLIGLIGRIGGSEREKSENCVVLD